MLLFPFDTIRPGQEEFMTTVQKAITNGTNAIIHAPTGLGKTAAALAPAISEAQERGLTVLFLTSRHTQHDIAMKTLESINERFGTSIVGVDIIGKKWMCLQSGAARLPSGEFSEFCRALREDEKCDYYSELKKNEGLTVKGKLALEELSRAHTVRTGSVVDKSKEHGVCPYYLSIELAKKARVIVCDYYYAFHPKIREQFFARTNNELESTVIIVDEAHNLPERIKHLASARLSSIIIKRAISEANKHQLLRVSNFLTGLLNVFDRYLKGLEERKDERMVSREAFIEQVNMLEEYDEIKDLLIEHGDQIREQSQVSYVGAVGGFLEQWLGADEGFTRIFSRRKGVSESVATLSYRCLDPSIISEPVINNAHSTVLMSGTLTPTSMYKEILGCKESEERVFTSPFPDTNRLQLIIPKTSTKYQSRSEQMYQDIANVLTEVVESIPGNSAVFFTSYQFLASVNQYFQTRTSRTVFVENQQMTSAEKQEFIDRYRTYKDSGAVLLGVITGNFGEGIDLPGDELKGVVIVGLPLQRPDLETESVIAYYDNKFGKGWDYGYLFPAFNKTLQSAGRCIRSEKDRGVIVYLDERYAWPNYKRCFPSDANVKISLLYKQLIKEFFSRNT